MNKISNEQSRIKNFTQASFSSQVDGCLMFLSQKNKTLKIFMFQNVDFLADVVMGALERY